MPFCILKQAVLHRRTARIARPNGPLGRAGHRLFWQNAWPERLLCISLHNTSCTRQSVSKLPLRSFALSLHNTSCNRQSVSKLTLHSFAVHFHFQRPSVPAAQVAPSRGLQPGCRGQTTWQYMAKTNSGIRQKGVLRAATALAGCFAAAGSPDSDSPGGQGRWL